MFKLPITLLLSIPYVEIKRKSMWRKPFIIWDDEVNDADDDTWFTTWANSFTSGFTSG